MNEKIPKFKGIKSYEESCDLNKTNYESEGKVLKIDPKKKELDNNKRLQSLKQKQNVEKNQQNWVKSSLNSENRLNKRIVFESINDLTDKKRSLKSDKTIGKTKKLFESDSEEDSGEEEDNIKEFERKINTKISDKNAEKLIELNSRFAHDLRFKIDDKFLDLDNNNKNNDEVIDEKNNNFRLLEEVLGKKVKPILKRKSSERNSDKSSELFVSRFDPKNKNSSIYEVFGSNQKKKVKFNEKVLEKPIEKETKVENVSQEVYYEFGSALKESLESKGEEFSLTQMFGNSEDQKKHDFNNEYNSESIVHNPNHSSKSSRNPFKYDSSESEDENDDNIVFQTNNSKRQMSGIAQKFFFSPNDPRFEEDLFYSKELVEKAKNDWKDRKLMLIKAIGLRKRSAKKNIKSEQKRVFKMRKFHNYKSFKRINRTD